MIGPIITTRKSLLLLLVLVPTAVASLRQTKNVAGGSISSAPSDECESIGTASQNTASVLLNFVGDGGLEDSDYRDLEAAFQVSLANVVEDSCFDLENVMIDTSTETFDDSRRMLLLGDGKNNYQRNLSGSAFTFSFYFNVVYQCYSCGGLYLGNDGSRRALLDDGTDRLLNFHSELPTRNEFNEAFNNTLSNDPSFSNIQLKIQGVKVTSELEERQCHSQKRSFDTDLIIIFDGDIEECNDDVLSVIEDAVRKAYNTMNLPNPYSCDTEFRKIQHVNCIDRSPMDDGKFILSFSLEYECRGCWQGSESPVLFGTYTEDSADVGRSDLYVDFRELGPKEPECSCDKEAKFERAPTVEEVTKALQRTLDIRSDEGKIPRIGVVVVGEEQEEKEYCCSNDYKACKQGAWCNKSESNCGRCNGHWMEVNSCGPDGIPRWKECTNNVDKCCSPATCTFVNGYYSQCL
mmetsp:Transcript_6018/g.8768  ORF Transcript_6018/g.8768 Transcript_6018/m.8768 type:complete len:463 (+) Transcript_6018:105-1493(+)